MVNEIIKYYRTYNESHDGDVGFYYCEVINNLITRQIIAFNGNLYWATLYEGNNELYDFTDQPEFDEEHITELRKSSELVELSKEEFEQIWKKAKGT